MGQNSIVRDGLRGLSGWAILKTLSRQPLHGYALMKELQAAGLTHLKPGVAYPLLHQLESEGHLSPTWEHADSGPARKVFTLTPSGRELLATVERELRAATTIVSTGGKHVEG